MEFFKNLAFCLSCITYSTSGQATVSALAEVAIPVKGIQTNDICLQKQQMIAEYGIPLLSNLEGVFAPNRVLLQVLGGTSFYVNTNLLADGGKITFDYNSDSFEGDVWSYDIDLNFTSLTTAAGTSLTNRKNVIDTVKLALIAVNETAILTHGTENFRLKLNLVGLPSQTGLSGSRVFPSTRFPYTSSSPLIASYKSELIGGSCPSL